MAQAAHSVRHGLEAGLPCTLDAEGDLVAERSVTKRRCGSDNVTKRQCRSRRWAAHTASTHIVHWIGLSFIALCVEQDVWNCTSTQVYGRRETGCAAALGVLRFHLAVWQYGAREGVSDLEHAGAAVVH